MSGALSLRFSSQAQLDIRRISQQLTQLQGQVASGQKANDLLGFGGGAGQLLSAKTLKASADAHISIIGQIDARLGVQATALSQVSSVTQSLAQTIREALSANDGRGVAVDLNLTFSSVVDALNTTWNGQPLFAGERQTGDPVKITTLDQLVAAAGPSDIYNEATRAQTVDLGSGTPIKLADKASEMSQQLFDTLKQLKIMVDNAGGQLGSPLSGPHRDQLMAIAATLDTNADQFVAAEGRTGQLQNRLDDESTRLQQRADLITKEIGDQADADPAQISIEMSALLAQYQAAAKTFADLSKLSLLNYL